jgi:hypothetical protein
MTKKDINRNLYYSIESIHSNFYGDDKELKEILEAIEKITTKKTENIIQIRDLHIYLNPNWNKKILISMYEYLSKLEIKYKNQFLDDMSQLDSEIELKLQ